MAAKTIKQFFDTRILHEIIILTAASFPLIALMLNAKKPDVDNVETMFPAVWNYIFIMFTLVLALNAHRNYYTAVSDLKNSFFSRQQTEKKTVSLGDYLDASTVNILEQLLLKMGKNYNDPAKQADRGEGQRLSNNFESRLDNEKMVSSQLVNGKVDGKGVSSKGRSIPSGSRIPVLGVKGEEESDTPKKIKARLAMERVGPAVTRRKPILPSSVLLDKDGINDKNTFNGEGPPFYKESHSYKYVPTESDEENVMAPVYVGGLDEQNDERSCKSYRRMVINDTKRKVKSLSEATSSDISATGITI